MVREASSPIPRKKPASSATFFVGTTSRVPLMDLAKTSHFIPLPEGTPITPKVSSFHAAARNRGRLPSSPRPKPVHSESRSSSHSEHVPKHGRVARVIELFSSVDSAEKSIDYNNQGKQVSPPVARDHRGRENDTDSIINAPTKALSDDYLQTKRPNALAYPPISLVHSKQLDRSPSPQLLSPVVNISQAQLAGLSDPNSRQSTDHGQPASWPCKPVEHSISSLEDLLQNEDFDSNVAVSSNIDTSSPSPALPRAPNGSAIQKTSVFRQEEDLVSGFDSSPIFALYAVEATELEAYYKSDSLSSHRTDAKSSSSRSNSVQKAEGTASLLDQFLSEAKICASPLNSHALLDTDNAATMDPCSQKLDVHKATSNPSLPICEPAQPQMQTGSELMFGFEPAADRSSAIAERSEDLTGSGEYCTSILYERQPDASQVAQQSLKALVQSLGLHSAVNSPSNLSQDKEATPFIARLPQSFPSTQGSPNPTRDPDSPLPPFPFSLSNFISADETKAQTSFRPLDPSLADWIADQRSSDRFLEVDANRSEDGKHQGDIGKLDQKSYSFLERSSAWQSWQRSPPRSLALPQHMLSLWDTHISNKDEPTDALWSSPSRTLHSVTNSTRVEDVSGRRPASKGLFKEGSGPIRSVRAFEELCEQPPDSPVGLQKEQRDLPSVADGFKMFEKSRQTTETRDRIVGGRGVVSDAIKMLQEKTVQDEAIYETRRMKLHDRLETVSVEGKLPTPKMTLRDPALPKCASRPSEQPKNLLQKHCKESFLGNIKSEASRRKILSQSQSSNAGGLRHGSKAPLSPQTTKIRRRSEPGSPSVPLKRKPALKRSRSSADFDLQTRRKLWHLVENYVGQVECSPLRGSFPVVEAPEGETEEESVDNASLLDLKRISLRRHKPVFVRGRSRQSSVASQLSFTQADVSAPLKDGSPRQPGTLPLKISSSLGMSKIKKKDAIGLDIEQSRQSMAENVGGSTLASVKAGRRSAADVGHASEAEGEVSIERSSLERGLQGNADRAEPHQSVGLGIDRHTSSQIDSVNAVIPSRARPLDHEHAIGLGCFRQEVAHDFHFPKALDPPKEVAPSDEASKSVKMVPKVEPRTPSRVDSVESPHLCGLGISPPPSRLALPREDDPHTSSSPVASVHSRRWSHSADHAEKVGLLEKGSVPVLSMCQSSVRPLAAGPISDSNTTWHQAASTSAASSCSPQSEIWDVIHPNQSITVATSTQSTSRPDSSATFTTSLVSGSRDDAEYRLLGGARNKDGIARGRWRRSEDALSHDDDLIQLLPSPTDRRRTRSFYIIENESRSSSPIRAPLEYTQKASTRRPTLQPIQVVSPTTRIPVTEQQSSSSFEITFQLREPVVSADPGDGSLIEFGIKVLVSPSGPTTSSDSRTNDSKISPRVDPKRVRSSSTRNKQGRRSTCSATDTEDFCEYEYSRLSPAQMREIQEEAQETIKADLLTPGTGSSHGERAFHRDLGLQSPFSPQQTRTRASPSVRPLLLCERGLERPDGMVSTPSSRPCRTSAPRPHHQLLASPIPYIHRAPSRPTPSLAGQIHRPKSSPQRMSDSPPF